MTLNKTITEIVNGTIESINTLVASETKIGKLALITEPYPHDGIGVLIGMTGDIRGRVLIDGKPEMFSSIGQAMFGMPIEGEMLESFSGELGNMLAGNLATNLSAKGLVMDITPPTVLVGQSKVYGFDKAVRLPVELTGLGELKIVLMIDMDLK
ncbi:chemotaxis protein CheX [Mangrovibacillus cuniculi]|uniref:Chemotaxis protein CheX n=1 Tax=Mangrovibacillus cuniculi TaxID=2593652 RepID=A0A7S8CAZ1_9BACI|nr:chemotaxis protein CheX [Mangrovibacillus cuniculi]QPC46650.1 chemotaxis protein CheX [Mangrovibacillus cuniculi]